MRGGDAAWLAVRYAAAFAALAVFLFPLYWLVVTALKTQAEILSYPPVWWPRAPELTAFTDLVRTDTARAVINSLVVASLSTALAVGLGVPGAYALARWRLGGRILTAWALAARMAPPVLIAFAFVLVLPDTDRVGDLAVLTLMLTAFNLPYVLWMMHGYFRDVPVALEESAMVAGLSRDQVFGRVVWPVARGGCLATAAFTFVLAWNELIFALVLTDDPAATLPVRLAHTGSGPQLWRSAAALGVVGMLPALVALVLMRGRLVRTLSLGIVKG